MRKITIYILIVVLMISVINCNKTFATSEEAIPQEESEQIENVPEENTQPTQEAETIQENTDSMIITKAIVIEVGQIKDVQTGSITDKMQEVKIEILNGEYKAKEFTTNYNLSYDIDGKIQGYELKEGDKVTVQITKDKTGNVNAQIQELNRSQYIVWMIGLFLLSIILVGGKQGAKAILGLLITVIAVYFVLIKGIYTGYNVILVTILTSAIIIGLTFIIIGGFSKKILAAALGTLGGVVSSGIIAIIFSHLAKLSGAGEDAINLSMNMTTVNFNFRSLIFAGIVIAALGACMDVGMSIASSLNEIKSKTSDISWKELFKSGMNIGKDVIGTMTNTLILAYVGGALTLTLLFLACNMGIGEILNKETIAQEIISALAGSMGVVFTVPITSIIYSILNRKKTFYKTTSENKLDGQRSLKL